MLEPLEAFLAEVKAEHPDDLVVISTHAGLHALGIQPESNASDWGGEELGEFCFSIERNERENTNV